MSSVPQATQSSFSRGLSVLVAVAENGDVSVEDVAAELGMPLSTAYRYIRTLRDFELVEEHEGRYVPGWRLLELSGQHLTHARLAEIGASVLRDVVDTLSETAVLTVRVGSQAMCLRQIESPHPIRYAFRINQLLPLHAGAGQRVLLAYAPATVIQRVLASPLPRYTGHTHDRERLRHDLEHIRSTGAAVSHGELNAGAVAVAAPVYAGGEVVCSLTVAGPESRCGTKSWPAHALASLRAAADTLSLALERSGR
ncbi:MAG: IclR family transcriptional regulator [Jatrophihabitans sp.]|nr:MAG: IclR family transcriptional regulator [Jatrophihabitans sp.]